MWNNVMQLTNKLKQVPPRMISHNNKVVTSISKITNIANNHYKNKVEKIRKSFTTNHNIDPIQLLHNLIPKPNTTFELPLPTHNDIAEIIKKATSSYSVGNDIINMNIIKKLTPLIIPHITHLLTNIIIYEKYPTILKNTRISPSLKVDKPPENIDSYHLSVIYKL